MATPSPPAAPAAPAPGASTPAAPAFDPKGKTFLQRLAAFLAGAKTTYGVDVKKDSGRSAEWEQKHHIAHMFAYNKYKNSKPAHVEPGGNTIAWDYFTTPSVIWQPLVWSDFLRTKEGSVPTISGNAWEKGKEPDKDKTLENTKAILIAAQIGNSGQAMVACGYSPCGEPCKCTAGRSKHLTEEAADLNSVDIGTLNGKLAAAKAGNIDTYLATFGLNRPLKDHPESPEEWHVEATG